MKNICLITTLVLCACTTPVTVMKHPRTGNVVTCGGKIGSDYVYAVGPAGSYLVQRSHDADCVKGYAHDGYVITGGNQ